MSKNPNNKTEKGPVVVANSFDVSVGRIPSQAITLEDYRRLGGVSVTGQDPQASVGGDAISGSRNDNYASYSTFDGYDSGRNNHAIIVEQPKKTTV